MATRKKASAPRVFVALDVDDQKAALNFAKKLKSAGVGFKVGPRLLNRYGGQLVKKLAQFGPIFIDQKFFDIPSTMVAAIQAAFDSGASFATIHALSGKVAMAQIAKLENELNKKRFFKVLCVTILTSFDEKGLPAGLRGQKISDLVHGLVDDVLDSGLSGVVCSPFEIEIVRGLSPNLTIVTPGIRSSSDKADDQTRTMEAAQAFSAGASSIVIGRPILNAKSPKGALETFLNP